MRYSIFQKKISNYLLSVILVLNAGVLIIPLKSEPLEFDSILIRHIHEALQNNPNLKVLQNRIDAAVQHLPQAGAWTDPSVKFGLINLPVNSFDFNQEPMTGTWITITQQIPINGKSAIQSEIAELNLKSIEFDRKTLELRIAERIAHTWHNLAYLNEADHILDTKIKLLDDLIEVVKRKYETGKGNQHDILRAETERTGMEDKRIELKQRIKTTGRQLAVLMGRNPDDIPELPVVLIDTFSAPDQSELLHRLFKDNPDWKKMATGISTSKLHTEIARRSRLPDLKLSTAYGFRQDADNNVARPDLFSVTAGITVPIFINRKQNPAVQEKIAIERAAIDAQRSMRLELELKMTQLLDEDKRLEEQIYLYVHVIELQAAATLASITSAYAVGKTDFEALLAVETALFNYKLERLVHIRDRLNLRASIANLIGGSELLSQPDKF